MRAFSCLLLLLSTLVLFGCSDGGSDAPADNAAHPAGWLSLHGAEALKTPEFTGCTSCHGADLRGSEAVPSCYSASFNGQACHAGGPGAPHPLDGTYLSGASHGPDAKRDLTACQACHGQTGGPGGNPRFNLGIAEAGGQGCEGCHGAYLAHPAVWAGPNNTFHYSAGNVQNACTLCHGLNLDGVGGVGVSCLGCHDDKDVFTLDCAFCHGYPPTGTTDLAAPNGVNHRGAAALMHDVCVVCHGAKENAAGGYFAAVPAYALFDKSTDTPGAHWDGRINMNAETAYNQANFGCDAAGCHGNDAAHQLSDSQLPVVLDNYGSGTGAIPHEIPFRDQALHGPAAKGLTAAFPDGLANCRPCHASATTPPRFNVGIGGQGCETCHNVNTAHPSSSEDPTANENVPWYNGGVRHDNARAFTTQCVICHGVTLQGGVGPACSSCHPGDPVANPAGCLSCHNIPPNGAAPAGNVRPNRNGRHSVDGHQLACTTCHGASVYRTPTHFDPPFPPSAAEVQFTLGPGETITFDATNSTCTGLCHGENHPAATNWY